MSVTLLGPQRFRASARTAVRALGVEGPVAVVNAGWLEREADDAELNEVLDGRVLNLRLHGRWEQILAEDLEYAEGIRAHDAALDEQRALYLLQLEHAVAAAYAVWRRTESVGNLHGPALDHAIEHLRTLDAWHLDVASEMEAQFDASMQVHDRESVARHRAEVAELLAGAAALVLTGGHVGVLLRCLRLFLPDLPPGLPVVAWSAGAMAISERIVLFHDTAAQGPAYSEVFRRGLGLYRGIVALPHARRRLRLGNEERVAAMARRFADAVCLVLDDGVQIPLPATGGVPAGVPVLDRDGQVLITEAA